MALELKFVVEASLLRLQGIIHSLYELFKQLYVTNKTEHFSYKGGCSIRTYVFQDIYIGEELILAIDKWLLFISNVIYAITVRS